VIVEGREYWTIGNLLSKADRKTARATLPPPDCHATQILGGEWVIVSDGGIPVWRANREDILSHPAVISREEATSEFNVRYVGDRPELEKLAGKRMRFSGTFERYGTKRAYRGPDLVTILLKDVKDDKGRIVSDHLWFNLTTEFEYCGMTEGDAVSFDARVTGYEKGYFGHRMVEDKPCGYDYRLARPTKVSVEPKEDRHGATDNRP
jgi:hypothetical protein